MLERAHAHQLRKGRFSSAGHAYLVTATTHNRAPLFRDFYLGRLVVSEFRQAQERCLVETLAWVVMPDHLHWLFVLRSHSLAKVMQRVKSRSAIGINKVQAREGRVWQAGYHDVTVRQEQDLLRLARYVIANPVRAGLVAKVGDYPLWDTKYIG